MLTRRRLLRTGVMAGAGLLLPWRHLGRRTFPGGVGRVFAAIAGGTLDPTTIPKYMMPLIIPSAMPGTRTTNVDYYEIAVRQF